MKTAAYIAQRIKNNSNNSFVVIAYRLAITSIAVGVTALMVSYAILNGFQHKVKEKVFGFDSHIQVSRFDMNNSAFDNDPISIKSDLYKNASAHSTIDTLFPYAFSRGILHANEHVYGCLLKGVPDGYLKQNIAPTIVNGELPVYKTDSPSKEIILSQYIANKLDVNAGDRINFYFFDGNKLKPRKLTIKSIYQTYLEEFDQRMIICDIQLAQQLHHWGDTLVGGYEIFLNDYSKINEADDFVYEEMSLEMQSEKITDKYAYLFDWLNLLDQNVGLFIIILMIIAFFNITSVMYILMLERTNMIGILKALGADKSLIVRVFWYIGLRILIKGLLIGNAISFTICLIQYYFHIIPLDPVNYYMAYVPIYWAWDKFILVNILTTFFVSATLLVPIYIGQKVSIIKSIRFD